MKQVCEDSRAAKPGLSTLSRRSQVSPKETVPQWITSFSLPVIRGVKVAAFVPLSLGLSFAGKINFSRLWGPYSVCGVGRLLSDSDSPFDGTATGS